MTRSADRQAPIVVSGLAVAAILAQLSGPAAAASGRDEASSPMAAAPMPAAPGSAPSPEVWYGSPALVTDGAAVALLAAGLGAKHSGLLLLGGAGYLIGAPINHVLNRRPGAAVGSFFLRQVAAAVAIAIPFVSYAVQGCDSDGAVDSGCELWPALVAGGVVLAGAAVLDDLAIARKKPPAPRAAHVSWAPGLLVAPNLGMLSLGGSF